MALAVAATVRSVEVDLRRRPVSRRLAVVALAVAGSAAPGGRERRQPHTRDPINGRVLVLMVPDSRVLPPDLDLSKYRVFLRFARS